MRYRTKPFEIEAIEFTGDNWPEVVRFAGAFVKNEPDFGNISVLSDKEPVKAFLADQKFLVYDYIHQTWITFFAGNFIVRGMKNEFYPCDAEVFNAKYEVIDE